MIDILIPTYGRAHRIADIVKNIEATTLVAHNTWFIVEQDDTRSQNAVNGQHLEYIVNNRARNYSGAINTAYEQTAGQYLFAGADDLYFQNGWAEEAIRMFDGFVGVVGTMDGVNPYVNAGSHATHYMVDRKYLDQIGGIVDLGPGSFLFEGYGHNYTDTEFIGTAKMRAKFRPCFTSHVRHLHWTTAGGIAPDATTEKENATYSADSVLYDARRELWFNISR